MLLFFSLFLPAFGPGGSSLSCFAGRSLVSGRPRSLLDFAVLHPGHRKASGSGLKIVA